MIPTLDDAAWIAPLWRESVLAAQEWWPIAIPADVTEDQARMAIAAPDNFWYCDPKHQGFFVVRPGYLPEHPSLRPEDPPGAIAAELVIWIIKRNLAAPKYRALIISIFSEWLDDEVMRGQYQYGFGCMPASMPAGDRTLLDAWVTKGGVKVVDYIGPGGVPWRRYYGELKNARVKLP